MTANTTSQQEVSHRDVRRRAELSAVPTVAEASQTASRNSRKSFWLALAFSAGVVLYLVAISIVGSALI